MFSFYFLTLYTMTPGTTPIPEMTLWERLVGKSFNPSGDDAVITIKSMYASIIDLLNDARSVKSDHSEYQRYISIAITEAQTAQMRAVKAVTAR